MSDTVTLHLNLPEPFHEAWVELLRLGETVLTFERPSDYKWVLGALARKAARTMYGVASLASLMLWGDALVLGRTLFEVHLTTRLLSEGDLESNVADYLEQIAAEQARLERKMAAGRSVTAKVLADLWPAENTRKKSTKAQASVRERAMKVDMERLYDIPYWISSAFAHSSPLSLSEWNDDLSAQDPLLVAFFSLKNVDAPSWLTFSGLPYAVIQTYLLVDRYLNWEISERVELVRRKLQAAVSSASDGVVRFDDGVPKGGVVVSGWSVDGQVKVYTPNRT